MSREVHEWEYSGFYLGAQPKPESMLGNAKLNCLAKQGRRVGTSLCPRGFDNLSRVAMRRNKNDAIDN